jgi:hypothetical protein
MNVSTRITINGREYNSVDEMPPDVLAIYEQSMSMLADRNGNGIPDIMEGGNVKITGGENFKMISAVSRKITVNGKSYERLEDLPADLQQRLRGNGIGAQTALSAPVPDNQTAREIPPMIAPQEGFSPLILIVAFLAATAVTALIAWMLFARR